MTVSTDLLLNLLGSTVRSYGTTGAEQRSAHGTASDVEAVFAQMLSDAQTGELSTGLPVAIEPAAGALLERTLSTDEIAALSQIADRATAQGAETVSVIRDNTVLTLDVRTRRVTGVNELGAEPTPGGAMIARLPESFEHALGLPGTLLSHSPETFNAGLGSVNMNASLRALLGGADS